MSYRIFVDESGTHDAKWFIIGMLFVPDHGALHSELCKIKDECGYNNTSAKKSAQYKEIHFKKFRSGNDARVAKRWIDAFIKHNCFYRSIVIDWSTYDGRYFGDPFDSQALKKRRAYKKWAELLIQPELTNPSPVPVKGAELYLDHLNVLCGYDILSHLEDRFTGRYEGTTPYIRSFQHTHSWKDANQCLQLCDLLTGCLYHELEPGTKEFKIQVRDYLKEQLKAQGVAEFRPEFWKGFDPKTLRTHFPKYSAWFWKPTAQKKRKKK